MFRNDSKYRRRPSAGKIFLFLLAGVAILVAVAAVVQFLWNSILVDAAGARPISFLEAAGLFILAKILFGGIGFGRSHSMKRRRNHRRSVWREKWRHMSDDEKAEMKEKWRDWCRKRE